jgi:hypothetical protein
VLSFAVSDSLKMENMSPSFVGTYGTVVEEGNGGSFDVAEFKLDQNDVQHIFSASTNKPLLSLPLVDSSCTTSTQKSLCQRVCSEGDYLSV